ncbi:restriction endonuclease subunit S, partial [Staphylococcus cohnii]
MTNELKNIPDLRFPEFDREWEEMKLGDIGKVAMNKRIYKKQTSPYEEIPFYKIGTFGKKSDTFISRNTYEEYKTKFPYPKVGDILISASGSIGRTIEYKGQEAYYQDSNIVWLDHDD